MSAASAADYRETLHRLRGEARTAFLRKESRLPGPRANLELLGVAVDVASPDELRKWAALSSKAAPANTPREFLALVGAAGLGRLIAEGDRGELETLRRLASDPRWRIREGVAIALQRVGRIDMGRLVSIAAGWAGGSRFEQRAAIAGLAEPPLLHDPAVVAGALDIFDTVTGSIVGVPALESRSDGFRALLKALGYGWSVLVAAAPEIGRSRMERWLESDDPAVRRIMRENLTKIRLERADGAWTAAWRKRLATPTGG